MRRRSRFHSSLISAAAAAAFSLGIPSFAFHFEGDAPAGGEGGDAPEGGAGGGGGSGGAPPKPKKTYTETEFVPVVKARDKAKGAFKALLRAINIDPDDVTIVETGDVDNPYAVEGVDDVAELLEKARGESDESPEAKRKRAELARKRIAGPIERKLALADRKVAALQKWIEENGVVAPIRAACSAENIVDDDEGKFDDVVDLLRPRFAVRVNIDEDDDRAKASVVIETVNAEGDPLVKDSGESYTPREMVADLAKRKPKFRNSGYRPGPGAGGQGDRARGGAGARQEGNRPPTRAAANGDRVLDAAKSHYGLSDAEAAQVAG